MAQVKTGEFSLAAEKSDEAVRSGKLLGIYTELFHARKESCPVYAETCRCSIGASNASFAIGKGAHDLLALLVGISVSDTFLAIERVDGFPYNLRNILPVLRWRCLP